MVASGPDEQWLPRQKLQQQQPMEALVYEILSLPLYSICVYIYICIYIYIYIYVYVYLYLFISEIPYGLIITEMFSSYS